MEAGMMFQLTNGDQRGHLGASLGAGSALQTRTPYILSCRRTRVRGGEGGPRSAAQCGHLSKGPGTWVASQHHALRWLPGRGHRLMPGMNSN